MSVCVVGGQMGRGRAGKDAGTMQARCKCCGVRAGVFFFVFFLHVRGGDEMITPLVVSQFACLTIVLPNFRTSLLCSLPFWWRFFRSKFPRYLYFCGMYFGA